MKRKNTKKRKAILFGLLVLAIISAPILVFTQKQQDVRSRASAASVLSYSPTSTQIQPIHKNVDDPFSLDVMLNPGTNAVSILKLDIHFDPFKIQPGANPLVINPAAFSTIVEGPVVDSNTGDIIVTLSVGTDPTKAIKTLTKIATVNLVANGQTFGGTTTISFGSQSQAFSVAAGDQATQNVLATAMPDYIAISPSTGGPTPTNGPGPTSITLPTDTPSPGVSLAPGDTTFNYTVFLHAIGNSGDSTNPTGTTFSNKNPQTTQRDLDISVFDSTGQEVVNTSGTMSYDSLRGNFTGNVDLGTSLPPGNYTVKVQSQSYLRKLVPGILTITSTTDTYTLPSATLVAGDINGDNTINIIDYNILLGCYSDILAASFCPSQNQSAADLTDDGSINQFDYNLFLREIQIQNGN